MEMKEYLLDSFLFNDQANRKMIERIRQLPSPAEALKLFSHLINSQLKWMARIKRDPASYQMSWWDPVYETGDLETKWKNSLDPWLACIQSQTEQQILEEWEFKGFDGNRWCARLLDIALQLNYHSIHHRAQIQMLIRSQGLEPDFIDYIGTKYRKMD